MANNSAIAYLANQANDQSAGQSGGVAPITSARHPTGWVNVQRWYVTAQQWHDMWAIEWANARDQQGFTYSYPGQAAYAVLWSQSASYWRAQADYVWGPSRLYQSGNSWEALAASEWGPSRAYGSGNTWEDLYNNTIPSAIDDVSDGNAVANSYNGPPTTVKQLSVNKTGYWKASYYCTISGCPSGGSTETMTLRYNGSTVASDTAVTNESGHSGGGVRVTPTLISNGQTIDVQIVSSQSGTRTITNHILTAVFVPTPAYPH